MERKGFTLIELLLVISILGLLALIIMVSLGSARLKARDARRMADLKQIQTALELYLADAGDYPPGTNIALGDAAHSCLNKSGFTNSGCLDPYMGQVPNDPSNSPSNPIHYYYTVAASSTYSVSANLEGSTSGVGPGTIHLTPTGIGP